MNKLAIIGVPSSAGARRNGQERAAQSFRGADFIDQLQSAGLEVIDFGDLPEVSFQPDEQHPKAQNLRLVADVAKRVAKFDFRRLHHLTCSLAITSLFANRPSPLVFKIHGGAG